MASGSGPTYRPDPWERLDTESNPAWQAFALYRDMGLERSQAKVATELGKSKQLIHRWSSTYSWVIRVAAYDREQDRQRLNALRAAHYKNADRMMTTAGAMLQVASQGLIQIANDPKKLKPTDVARLAEVAARLEAVVFGQQVNVSVGGPTPGASQEHVTHLTDEDRIVRMRQLQAELASRLGEEAS